VSETAVKRRVVPSPSSVRGSQNWLLYSQWRHGATLTDRQLHSVAVRCMLRSVTGVENGNSG